MTESSMTENSQLNSSSSICFSLYEKYQPVVWMVALSLFSLGLYLSQAPLIATITLQLIYLLAFLYFMQKFTYRKANLLAKIDNTSFGFTYGGLMSKWHSIANDDVLYLQLFPSATSIAVWIVDSDKNSYCLKAKRFHEGKLLQLIEQYYSDKIRQ